MSNRQSKWLPLKHPGISIEFGQNVFQFAFRSYSTIVTAVFRHSQEFTAWIVLGLMVLTAGFLGKQDLAA